MAKDPIQLGEHGHWLDLAGCGRDAWNTWAEKELKKPFEQRKTIDLENVEIKHSDFSAFKFPGRLNFSSAQFPRGVDFSSAKFHGHAYFSRAHFGEDFSFLGSEFVDDATFQRTIFEGTVDFKSARFAERKRCFFGGAQFGAHVLFNCSEFCGPASFSSAAFAEAEFIAACFQAGADFDRSVFAADACFRSVRFLSADYKHATFCELALFDDAEFTQPPDFYGTSFRQPPSFLDTTFCFHKAKDSSARYRLLKRYAAEAQDHESELTLFALETKAKRGHLLKWGRPKTWLELVLNHLYELTSDYGRSVLRPAIALLLTLAIAARAIALLAGASGDPWTWPKPIWLAAWSNLLPFVGLSATGRQVMETGVCRADAACVARLYAISSVETFFAIIFLFLLGFGLRNLFRVNK